ncbi:MAG TPA: gamma carbonic anhydrase family protein [Ilumatobacteraceae bacterium]|nr:gamma carbonic anhydrase family protein [Ilumatobacteraceae bacterium]
MPIYALGDQVPDIHPDAYVHPDAVVIGSVFVGANSSIWPCAVLRGDDGEIHVGERSSIQDGCVVHTTPFTFTRVDCVIGPLVHLEGCTIFDGALVGNGAIVMHNVEVHTGALVAANTVLLNNTVVPAGALAAGVPAVIKEGRAVALAGQISFGSKSYVQRAERFTRELRRID